ncbi:Arylsulfatase [Bremerella volcania]|uniref:Arylsulfatase n=1 Tax=Bremerella volcania TaxID=2527984 RepID=A0A518C905_9BACT|nr:sulfatase [Bremerella volcania]QDU75708.1 Arylsulfatase [Bremerella volcania]
MPSLSLHRTLAALLLTLSTAILFLSFENKAMSAEPGQRPNVVFILIDDMRFDAMGFMGHPFLKTPQIDAMAANGANFTQAFVTTSLCSPSRASILTGQYMHNHGVVDNNDTDMSDTIFFPQYLQQAGYQTGFFGKWHMGGGTDAPRPGFDQWVSFRGQGHYNPPGPKWTLNVNGKSVPQKGYITDELTDYAIDWLDSLDRDKPFFLYLSHKAVHARFEPAERHKDLYSDVEIEAPASQANTDENYAGKPMWVKNQRNSWHGVDFPYHSSLNIKEYYRDYCRCMNAVDDSVGRVRDYLKQQKLNDNTVVMLMGDNGFLFGEHGLIDKRNAYEESMRVPLVVEAPGILAPGSTVDAVVANIDIGPTILELAGIETPEQMDGMSFLRIASGKMDTKDWRKHLLYEYNWEWNFPQTPTMFALRGERYKFIQYHGIWDTDELYDLENDPHEMKNLIHESGLQSTVRDMRNALNQELKQRGAMQVPFGAKRGPGANLRLESGSKAAPFPDTVLREKDGKQ